MSGPVKTPSRILASLRRRNFCRRYRNAVPLRSKIGKVEKAKECVVPRQRREGGRTKVR